MQNTKKEKQAAMLQQIAQLQKTEKTQKEKQEAMRQQIAQLQKTEKKLREKVAHLQMELDKHVARAAPAAAAGTFAAQSNATAFSATMPAGAAGTFAAQSNATAFSATMPAGAAGTFAAQSNAIALPAGAGFVRMPFPIQVPVGGIGAPTGNFISSPAMWVRTHPNCTNHN